MVPGHTSLGFGVCLKLVISKEGKIQVVTSRRTWERSGPKQRGEQSQVYLRSLCSNHLFSYVHLSVHSEESQFDLNIIGSEPGFKPSSLEDADLPPPYPPYSTWFMTRQGDSEALLKLMQSRSRL